MRKFLVLLNVFFFNAPAFGQEYDSVFSEVDSVEQVQQAGNPFDGMLASESLLIEKPQTENIIYTKKFKENLSSRYKGQDFNYTTETPEESFLDRLMRKINAFLNSIFGYSNVNTSFNLGKIILIIFVVILVGFLIYFLIKYWVSNNMSFFVKKNSQIDIREENLHENIHEINFSDTIVKFENSAEYKLAVRYQFLLVLKKLSDQKLISWNPEKTNADYTNEIKDKNLKDRFSDLALIFDYIWYGDFGVDHNSYLKFKEQFQAFKPIITT